jgi:hypothetical protein
MHPRRTSHSAHAPPAEHAVEEDAARVRERLESLDDAIFGALGGCTTALAKARQLWPDAVHSLGWDQVEESREQYLRYAVEVTRRFESHEIRDPARALAALEVIELVTRGA